MTAASESHGNREIQTEKQQKLGLNFGSTNKRFTHKQNPSYKMRCIKFFGTMKYCLNVVICSFK